MKGQQQERRYLNLDVLIETIQPDYARWQATQVGMTLAEVREILGPPLRRPHLFGDGVFVYGYLQFPVMPAFRWYAFVLHFHQDRLFHKEDPFGGVFSPDGKPCKPQIITPQEGAVFDGDFRHRLLVDMRWHPVSGDYPMMYEMEIGTTNNRNEPFRYFQYPRQMALPYFVAGGHWTPGLPGCFRVRGVNDRGPGEWSDIRHFDFRDLR